MTGSGSENPWPSQRGANPYDPCFDPMHDIFLLSLRVPKCVARGIAIAESTYRKTSEAADLKSKEPRLRDWNELRLRGFLSSHPPWNQKNLDYEIETDLKVPRTVASLTVLKSKEPRLRDWNYGWPPGTIRGVALKSKEPRLRDWNWWLRRNGQLGRRYLKSKEPWLRDWNTVTGTILGNWLVHLKSKEPRLRDWNTLVGSWNLLTACSLEIKRTSITRLKLLLHSPHRLTRPSLKSKEPRLRDWNGCSVALPVSDSPSLKSKEPRLRDWNLTPPSGSGWQVGHLKSKEPRLRDWNSLDRVSRLTIRSAWNQKNLDYEIETRYQIKPDATATSNLKSKEPRLRDWNNKRDTLTDVTRCALKSKEPRLRDWNFIGENVSSAIVLAWNQKNLDYEIETCPRRTWRGYGCFLEIKRTSITRLKLLL